jgi:2-octaprenyl-6-methoxyphenol hydroxylase
MIHKPIVIVGGGPVGMVVAIKLASHGHKDITILDANPGGIQDGRVLALSYASCKLLEDINAWDEAMATAIKQVHISHSGLGISQINAKDVHLPELGYTIKYTDLCNRLQQCMANYPEIKLTKAIVKEVIPGKSYAAIAYNNNEHLTTDLVILAEGGRIKLNQVQYKEHDYGQVAIIASIKTELKHNNVAFERFDDSGALVLLPHENRYVLVWSCPTAEKEYLQNPENLLQKLKELKFMKRFGKFEVIGKVHSFPLKLQVAKNRILDRVILVGNSAQIVHPVSAQGLNLGLRDIDALLELAGDDLTKISESDKKRINDSKFVIGFTHFLARFLEAPYTKHLRGLGIMMFSNCKPIQNKLTNSLIFGY